MQAEDACDLCGKSCDPIPGQARIERDIHTEEIVQLVCRSCCEKILTGAGQMKSGDSIDPFMFAEHWSDAAAREFIGKIYDAKVKADANLLNA